MSEWINPFEKFLPPKNLAELIIKNPIIPYGHIQFVTDICKGKIGDGKTPFNSLPFIMVKNN